MFFTCLFLAACDLVNPEEPLSAFLRVNSFQFITSAGQGVNSAQITDAWVFLDDLSLGVYELPATIPVVELGTKKLTVFPVVRENAVPSTPIIYPLYKRYETTVELTPEATVTINPSTAYVEKAIFEFIEEFNGNSHQLNGGTSNAVVTNNGVGEVQLLDKEMVEFTSSNAFIDLPISGGLPVFLEFDYKTDVELEVGLLGIDPNPNSPVNATIYNLILCPINRWNKVYVNLQADLVASQLPSYKLAFRASTIDTGCGNVVTENPIVLLDNLKLIRLTN